MPLNFKIIFWFIERICFLWVDLATSCAIDEGLQVHVDPGSAGEGETWKQPQISPNAEFIPSKPKVEES